MELKVKVVCSDIEEAKQIAKQLLDFEKEHSPHCTLFVEVEIN